MAGVLRRGAVLVATVTMLAGFAATPAQAAAPTDTGWQPDGPYDPYDVSACGTTLTVSDKVNQVEVRVREDGRGNSRTDYRGKYVVKITTADGRRAVLDNSGSYSIFEAANGDSYVPIQAPGLIFAVDDAEAAAFRRAGLPRNFYFTKGGVDLLTKDSREEVVGKPADPVSVCKLLH